jgi:hypothetical protein
VKEKLHLTNGLVFVRVEMVKHHYFYIGFLKEPKFLHQIKRLKGPKILDGGSIK